MKKLFSALFLAFSALYMPLFSGTIEPIEHPAVAKILNELPHHGVLMQRERDVFIILLFSR